MKKMIIGPTMREELELIQLILKYKYYSDTEKILAIENIINRILK